MKTPRTLQANEPNSLRVVIVCVCLTTWETAKCQPHTQIRATALKLQEKSPLVEFNLVRRALVLALEHQMTIRVLFIEQTLA